MSGIAQQGLREQYAEPGKDDASKAARQLFYDLMATPVEVRNVFFDSLSQRDVTALLRAAADEAGTPYAVWVDDPHGFTKQVLGETTWSKQRMVLEAIPHHKRIAVPSAFGTGKCTSSLDFIPLADGRMIRAGNLVGMGDFEVMSWAEDGAQTRRTARADWNAVETVYEVETAAGRRITRNAAHPLWTAVAARYVEGYGYSDTAAGTVSRIPKVRGWTPVGDLVVGDLVLVPEVHCAEGEIRVPDDHAKLLGYLLGDGGTSRPSTVNFHKPGDSPQAAEVAEIAGRLGCQLRLRDRCQNGIIGLDGGENSVLNLVREWGLSGVLSKNKKFPDWVWTLPNEQLALVVSRLFACDGWAYVGRVGKKQGLRAEVAIALASEQMVRDVEAAMLRLGVWGMVRHRRVKYGDERRDAWEWSCRDARALARLAEVLGEVPGRTEKIAEVVQAAQSRKFSVQWPNRNAPEGYRWEKIKSIRTLPEEQQTVAIEVDGEHTFVTSFVEHNTHLAARAALWRSLVHPFGTSLTVTTATRFRQVVRQLWPHIRTAVAKADLPLIADQTQLSAFDKNGTKVQIAYGFSAPPHDEAAVQGIHAPRLFIVVDEAGGISRVIGSAMRGLLTGEDTRLLAIGNPPTDDEGSWFEQLCEDEKVRTIPISAYDAPLQTGEKTQRCRACPSEVPPHRLGVHLVDGEWIAETLDAYGEDAPFVIAKVHARFPKGGPSRTIPSDWIDIAVKRDELEEFDPAKYVRMSDLGLADEAEHSDLMLQREAWVRLGVDVAADGGDEMVISRAVGDLGHLVHSSTGSANTNSVDVSGKVLEQIRRATALRDALGGTAPIRVKIDGIGVGWGVASTLIAWGSEGIHDAEIIPVIVSEDTYREDGKETLRPNRKRDEMWLTGRALLQPDRGSEVGKIRLRIDKRTRAQLAAPTYATTSAGRTTIETKKSLRARGVASPDRAESLLLAFYEPILKKKKKGGDFRVLA